METKSCCDTTKIRLAGETLSVCQPLLSLNVALQSCSLGPIPKLLDNSLAPDSHSFSSLCHHLSYFQHSCQQLDKCVDFCLLNSMDLFSTAHELSCKLHHLTHTSALPSLSLERPLCILAHSITVSKWLSLVQALCPWPLRCYTFLVLLLEIWPFLFSPWRSNPLYQLGITFIIASHNSNPTWVASHNKDFFFFFCHKKCRGKLCRTSAAVPIRN